MPENNQLPHTDSVGSSLANAFSQAIDQSSENAIEPNSSQENAEVDEQVNNQISREVHDSQYQVLWSKIMDKGNYQDPTTYTNIIALLFCWKNDCNDMDTEDEVNRLAGVLKDDFHYKTQIEYLDSREGLQVWVNCRVAAFVEANDGANNLLIVYYAGHGRPGSNAGSLILTGQMSTNDRKKNHDFVEWNHAEELLKPARADVLEIFDCCHAGYLGLVRGEAKKFEYLAATEKMGGTPVAGPESFTSALIFALSALVKEQPEGRFTTMELLNKIKTDAPHFPKNQKPVISGRDTCTSAGRIMLHPLKKVVSACETQPKPARYSDPAKHQVLTLRFYFDQKPSLARIEKLGLELNGVSEQNPALGVNCIRWGGLQSAVARSAQLWLDTLTKNRLRRQEPPRLVIPENWPSPKSDTVVYPVTPMTPVSDNEAKASPQFPSPSPKLLSPGPVTEGQSSHHESPRNSLDLNDMPLAHIEGPHERIEVSHQHSEGPGSLTHGSITTIVTQSY